jgi:hypothetical protein
MTWGELIAFRGAQSLMTLIEVATNAPVFHPADCYLIARSAV